MERDVNKFLGKLKKEAENYVMIGQEAPWRPEHVKDTLMQGHQWFVREIDQFLEENEQRKKRLDTRT